MIVRSHIGDARLGIEVEDECGGLPSGTVERIFSPFVQVGSNRRGHGLGLAIARQAIESQGGTITAQDIPGKGCVFTIWLPWTEPE